MSEYAKARWVKPKSGNLYLITLARDGGNVIATIKRMTNGTYHWTIVTQFGQSQSEYAAMRAVRRALRAQETTNETATI